jgi:predicted MPP superfamily phosphohydrolase
MNKIETTNLGINRLNKVYHISDIHVRNFKRHEEYSRVFSRLCDYIRSTVTHTSLICLTGDIVHAKTDVTPELIQEVQSFFKQLADIAPVLIIPGNHDANLNNSHRLDALTPIINAIDNKNILYVKDTCEFKIADKTFVHWSVFDKVTAPVLPATEVTKSLWSIFCQTVPLNSNQSPICQSVMPFKLVEPAVATI